MRRTRVTWLLAGLALTASLTAQAETIALPVKEAVVVHDDQMDQDLVNVMLTPEGQGRLAAFTRERVGHTIHLRVDGVVLMSPVVRSPIEGGALQLSPGIDGFGRFPPAEIAKRLNAGRPMEVSDDK